MTRRYVPTGADAERCRLAAADRDGVPWRRWAPMMDRTGAGALPGISGVVDEMEGLALTFTLAPRSRSAAASTVRSLVATPTASYLRSVVRTGRTTGNHQTAGDRRDLEVDLRCAKRAPEDIVIRMAITNHGHAPATTTLTTRLGTTDDRWDDDPTDRPAFRAPWEALGPGLPGDSQVLVADHADLGTWWLVLDEGSIRTETVEEGTGAELRSRLVLQPGETRMLRLRLSRSEGPRPPVGVDAEATLGTRAREAAAFGEALFVGRRKASDHRAARAPAGRPAADEALARLIWQPLPGGTAVVEEVFAALGLAVADAVAAQGRLSSIIDQHVLAAGPSTEPPVAAWAALRIHELVVSSTGRRDHGFLEGMFHALLDDYSRWVDRIDPSDRNPLQGGLLGLDGTGSTAASAAWMACYSVWMLSLAVELARDDQTYQDVAVTFLDTTLAMVSALDDMGGSGIGMWDENDGWYHDVARAGDGEVARLAGRSAIGLVPLLAVAAIPREALDRLPEVAVRLGWSLRHDMDLEGSVVRAPRERGARGDMLVSLVPAYRRVRVLNRLERGGIDIPVPMACLLLDVLDRMHAFDGSDPRDGANLRSSLLNRMAHDAPVWGNLLAAAMRRSLRDR
jgi:hypothetical protein